MEIESKRKKEMTVAKVCYITNNKIEKQHISIKNGQQVIEGTTTAFKLYEVYDTLDIATIQEQLAEKNTSKKIQVKIEVVESILAIKRVRMDNKEFLKIIVYEATNIEKIRDVFYADTLSVKETVTEIIKMGIGLMRSDIKDLVNIIEKSYRHLEVVEDEAEYGRTYWLKDIAKMCLLEIEKAIALKDENKKGNYLEENISNIGIEIDKQGNEKYAYIKVKEFSKWYEGTDYRKKLSVYTVREEFRNAGITICNPGRTEHTRAVAEGTAGKCLQKVVEFDIENLRKYCE